MIQKDETPKAEEPKDFKKKDTIGCIFLVIAGILIVGVIIGAIVGFSDSTYESPEKSAYDDAMGSYDWGEDYYYDSSEGAIKKKPW